MMGEPTPYVALGPTVTTSGGHPIDDNQNSLVAGATGPIVVGDFYLQEKLAHFNRERIPERVVHAKGGGAFGYFEVTHDITKYCKAKIFEKVGKKTPMFIRFSTVAGELGSADTQRDPRGFAIKFYTEEGNWDLVCNNTPVFFIRDTIKFPDFIHSQKRNPKTNCHDHDMFWDFLSLSPESIHQVTILFSDRGTPNGFRHMHGYGGHSFKMVNKDGVVHYVKFHCRTNQGIKNFSAKEADEMKMKDPDYAIRDLFNAIEAKDYPSWNLYIQVMPMRDAETYKWNILDITKVWPHKDYPLIPVGRMVLNKNPHNYFQDVEQAAFCPGFMPPGIEPSEDRMLQGRLFSYADTHRHRLGPNYLQIPVNRAWNATLGDYNARDGYMCVDGNKGPEVNYEPNSLLNAPKQNRNYAVSGSTIVTGSIYRHPQRHPNDDFEQPRNLYRHVMKEEDRNALISNIVSHLQHARRKIQERQVALFYKVDPDYGERVARGLGLPVDLFRESKM